MSRRACLPKATTISPPRTRGQLLRATERRLNTAGIGDARIEADLSWMTAFEIDRAELYARSIDVPEGAVQARPDDVRPRRVRPGRARVRVGLKGSMPPGVYAKWERACAKVAIESGGSAEQWQCLEVAADLIRAQQPEDGPTIAPEHCCVVVNADDKTVETDDGDVPLAPETVEMLACNCGIVDASTPDREKDRSVPRSLRRKVYARDGHRCRCCSSRHSLHVHHIIPWSCGGATCLENLITGCRWCHSLVHAGLFPVPGSLDPDGAFGVARWRDIHVPEVDLPSPGDRLTMVETAPPVAPISASDDLPAEIDCAWWRGNAHRIRCNESAGTFELRPGNTLGDDPGDSVGQPEVAQCATRPGRLGDLIGQQGVVSSLQLVVKAARNEGPLGHTLLSGPPGLGKTTIARAIAAELGAGLHMYSGPALRSPMEMLMRLAELRNGDVLFIDEIHEMPNPVAVFLYEAMQHGRLSISITRAGRRHPVTLRLPAFTLIGATTDEGQLPEPFVARFENREQLRYYDVGELTELIMKGAQ